MKKTLILLTGISVFLGAGYATWAYTPIGKKTIAKWLLKKWEAMAKQVHKDFDKKLIAKELEKLTYNDHELLFRYTRNDFMGKARKTKMNKKVNEQFRSYLKKMKEAKIMEKADLSPLDNIVLPG